MKKHIYAQMRTTPAQISLRMRRLTCTDDLRYMDSMISIPSKSAISMFLLGYVAFEEVLRPACFKSKKVFFFHDLSMLSYVLRF